jgi:hypothetical protein
MVSSEIKTTTNSRRRAIHWWYLDAATFTRGLVEAFVAVERLHLVAQVVQAAEEVLERRTV